MRTSKYLIPVVAAAAVALASPSAVATTGPAPAGGTTDVEALAQRGIDGQLSAADRDRLAGAPELARAIVDGERTRTGEKGMSESDARAMVAASGAAVDAAATCSGTVRYAQYFGATGGHVYDYNTRASWCWSGSSITSVTDNTGYFTNVSFIYRPNNTPSINQVTGSGASRQVHTSNSISVLADSATLTYNPHNYVTVSAGGGVSFRSTE